MSYYKRINNNVTVPAFLGECVAEKPSLEMVVDDLNVRRNNMEQRKNGREEFWNNSGDVIREWEEVFMVERDQEDGISIADGWLTLLCC